MKLPKFKNLPVIVKELFCRVGQDWHSHNLFIGELKSLDSEIAYAVAEELKISPKDLHSLTCVIENFKKSSVIGGKYLANKFLKLKIRITVEECELIDDGPVDQEEVQS